MPGFTVFVTLAAGVMAAFAERVPRSWLAIAAGASLVVAAVGIVISVDLTTWGSLLAAVFAVSAGALLGRLLPPGSVPMFTLLLAASILDVLWIASGGSGPEGFVDVANVTLRIGERSSTIGTLDILLAAAIASHWRGRGAGFVVAILAAPIGMIVANLYVAISGADNLPLVPFIGIGWLVTEAWSRRAVIRASAVRSG